MADVFISYSSTDRELAEALAADCRKKGLSVWWDTSTSAGTNFREEIISQLNAANSVFVIWTPNSIQSQWVLSEAQRALALGKLVPVRSVDLQVQQIPPPFDTIHTPILEESLSSHIQTARRSKWFQIKRTLLRKSLLLFGCALLVVVGWFAREKTFPKLQSASNLTYSDTLSDSKTRYMSAEGVWYGPSLLTTVNSVRVRCYGDEGYCEIFEADILPFGEKKLLRTFITIFKIISITQKLLVAEDESAVCVRKTLTVDRLSKSVALVRTKISKEGMCDAVQDTPLTLTLVDGWNMPP